MEKHEFFAVVRYLKIISGLKVTSKVRVMWYAGVTFQSLGKGQKVLRKKDNMLVNFSIVM